MHVVNFIFGHSSWERCTQRCKLPAEFSDSIAAGWLTARVSLVTLAFSSPLN